MNTFMETAGSLDWSPLWISLKTGIVATVIEERGYPDYLGMKEEKILLLQ